MKITVEIALDDAMLLNRARSLQRRGVQVLICGAIPRPMAKNLDTAGINVTPP